jgi:hypothetical protein
MGSAAIMAKAGMAQLCALLPQVAIIVSLVKTLG